MAFSCTFGSATPVELFERGSSRAALALVGYDDERDLSYSVLATLDSLPGGGDELAFSLVEYDGETDSEHTYWSGKDIPRSISDGDRKLIFVAAKRAVAELIEKYRPPAVFMCTIDRDMPKKALTKHFEIVALFEMLGYTATPQESYHGEKAWWLEHAGLSRG